MAERISVDIDVKRITRQLKLIGVDARKGLSGGLHDAAFQLRSLWIADINRFIDNPKPFTKKVFVKKSNPDNLISTTFLPPIQSEYLKNVIEGGLRRPGDIGTLSATILIPVNARLTKAGNFPRGSAVRWLATVEEKIKGAFVGSTGGEEGRTAVYQSFKSGKIKLLAVFERTIQYDRQLPLEKTTEQFAGRADDILQRSLDRVL